MTYECTLCGAETALTGSCRGCGAPSGVEGRPTRRIGNSEVERLRDRVDELRAWAKSRIAIATTAINAVPENATSTLVLVGERQALEAALRILGGKETPQ